MDLSVPLMLKYHQQIYNWTELLAGGKTMFPVSPTLEIFKKIYRDQGQKIGKQEGQRLALKHLLELKFGKLSVEFEQRLDNATSQQLLDWMAVGLNAEKINEMFEVEKASE